jgi:hypothetical protein
MRFPPPARRALPALLAALVWIGVPARAEDSRGFAANALWDDGKAEVSLFDARWRLHGEERRFEARMIVVKEDFRREQRVKAEGGPAVGTFEVLKLNHLRVIPSGTYDEHEMLSAYLERASLRVVKLAMSHFESCGITFVEVLTGPGSLTHRSHSYWDGEGDRTLEIPFADGGILYDALPLQLRGMDLPAGRETRFQALPSQISSHVRNLERVPMTLQSAGRATLEVPAGRFAVTTFLLSRPEGKDRYYFEAAFPYRLVRWETAEGGEYRLKESLRLDYWNYVAPGDASRLQQEEKR